MTFNQWKLQRQRHRRKQRSKKHPYRFKALLFAVVVIAVLIVSEIGISSISEELTYLAANKYLTLTVNKTAEKVINKYSDTEFIRMQKDESGNIVSLDANSSEINKFKSELSTKITNALNGRKSVGVPFGSLTEIALLNGRGFDVPVKLNYEGVADIEIRSEFISAGINQTCHRITLKVKAAVVSQSKLFFARADNTTEFIVSETIIVGNVPSITASAGLGIL